MATEIDNKVKILSRLVLKSKSILLIVLLFSISLNVLFIKNSKNYDSAVLELNKKTKILKNEYDVKFAEQEEFYTKKIDAEKAVVSGLIRESVMLLNSGVKRKEKPQVIKPITKKNPTGNSPDLLNKVIAQNFKLNFNLKENIKNKEIDIKRILSTSKEEKEKIIEIMNTNCLSSLKQLETHHKKTKIKNYIIGALIGVSATIIFKKVAK